MARPGVTYQEVVAAASHVKGEGKNITIENVRAVLGTGSISTINNHLRKWKETQHHASQIASQENLPEELVSLLKGLWERLILQSKERVTEIENNYQITVFELQEELHKYKNNNQRWQQLFNQWQQEKNKFSQDKLELEQALKTTQQTFLDLSAKQNTLLQQLQEKQERIEELNRLHKQSQDNLEHYRESTREQRLLAQQQHEQYVQQLQTEINHFKIQVNNQRDALNDLQQELQLSKHTYNNLEKIYEEEKQQQHKLAKALDESEKAKIEYFHKSEHWHLAYKESQSSLNEKTLLLANTQTESQLLSQKLTQNQQTLMDLQHQNKLLSSDKWTLSQEKSQLEGQLKQMQKMITA